MFHPAAVVCRREWTNVQYSRMGFPAGLTNGRTPLIPRLFPGPTLQLYIPLASQKKYNQAAPIHLVHGLYIFGDYFLLPSCSPPLICVIDALEIILLMLSAILFEKCITQNKTRILSVNPKWHLTAPQTNKYASNAL